MRGMYLIGMLVLLFLANIAMLMGMTNWPQRVREGFAEKVVAGKALTEKKEGFESPALAQGKALKYKEGSDAVVTATKPAVEGFMDPLTNGFATEAIGPYDGMNMAAGLPPAAQGFRARLPNEPLAGPPVEIGPDNLFYFKNNQCKPECCGATLSCDGGCVCSTPEQRSFINSRGGNRLSGDF